MLIKRTALCSSVIAFALAAQVASAQTPLPKVWPMYYPRGLAAEDPIFKRMITYNMWYSAVSWHERDGIGPGACGSIPPAYIGSPPGTYVSDVEEVAARIALEAIWRGQTRSEFSTTPDEDVAISIVRFADPVRQQLEPESGSMPNLYGHGTDWIKVERTRLTGDPVYYFRTVWMTTGIAEARSWMQDFVDKYEEFTTTCSSTVYRAAIPSRFVFDQEPPPILLGSPVGGTCESYSLACVDGFVKLSLIGSTGVEGDDPDPNVITWQDMLDYWATVKLDDRFGSGNEGSGEPTGGVPVPGCGGKTLWRLWWEARHDNGVEDPDPIPTVSSGPQPKYYYFSGSAANQKWFAWFSSINHQANIGAMDEAAYQVISAKWPGCMSSDYEHSMRTPEYLFRGSLGSQGPTGLRYPVETQFGFNRDDPGSSTFTQSPMEAGVLNALHFYSDVASDHWLKFRTESAWYGYTPESPNLPYPSEIQRWGNTGGTNEYSYGLIGNGRQSPLPGSDTNANNGDEFWEATSLRVNNFELANCFRANLPSGNYDAAEGMTAWITLPHQPIEYFDLAPSQQYNALTYANFKHLPMRQSAYSLYRTVADCRMHGVNEFMVWNDTGQDADDDFDPEEIEGPWGAHEGFYSRGGLHADRASNWNILRQVMHQVYAYDCTVQDIRGSYASAMSYSSGSPHFVERLRYADHKDADSTAVRAVMVDPAGSASNQTARIQLKFTPNGTIDTTGDCINFEVRLKTSIAASVKVEVMDVLEESTAWIRLGSGLPDTIASDLDGRHFYVWDIPTGTDFRTIRFRLPRTSVEGHSIIDATTGEVNIRITGILASSSSPSVTIDNAICYISDTCYRDGEGNLTEVKFNHPADLNADGVVDEKDDTLFDYLRSEDWEEDDVELPFYRHFVDYDRDGNIYGDSGDQAVWSTSPGIYGEWHPQKWSLDAHRYSMVDIAMSIAYNDTINSPTCPGDIGSQGGIPGGDGLLDNNDFIVFITMYFNSDSGADMGMAGGVPGSDTLFDNNDFIVFINYFFAGCAP